MKFYTEDGNWDLVGTNLAVFFIRDAIKFPDVIHSLNSGEGARQGPRLGIVQERMLWHLLLVHDAYGTQVAKMSGLTAKDVKIELASV